jgi:hypothetical protein
MSNKHSEEGNSHLRPKQHGNQENVSPVTSMLQSGKKRKKDHADPDNNKKIKENCNENENVGVSAKDKMPRKKLFRQRCQSLVPEELKEARTPQDSPIKSTQDHPCFSQAPATELKANCKNSTAAPVNSEFVVLRNQPRRDSMADFRSHILRKCHNERKELRRRNPSMVVVCTSLHSE